MDTEELDVIEVLNAIKALLGHYGIRQAYLDACETAITIVKKSEVIPETISGEKSYCPCCGAPLTPIRKMRVLVENDEIYCYKCGQKVAVQGGGINE